MSIQPYLAARLKKEYSIPLISPYGLFHGEYYFVPTVVLHEANNAQYLATDHHCLSQHFLLYCALCITPSSRDVPFGNLLILLASLFTRFFRLYDELVNIFMPAWYTHFSKHEALAIPVCSQYLLLLTSLCTAKLVLK